MKCMELTIVLRNLQYLNFLRPYTLLYFNSLSVSDGKEEKENQEPFFYNFVKCNCNHIPSFKIIKIFSPKIYL